MWDEHIRLFIRPVYFQPSGFMVIGKALPSRSFPEGVNISPSPSFLPLCLFFSNSIFSPKHHSPLPRTGKECWKAFERNKTHTHTHTHTHRQKCEVTERSASSDPGKTPAQDVSHFPALLIAVIHRCSVSLTDASLSLSVHGSSGALETDCGLFTTLMFANDF